MHWAPMYITLPWDVQFSLMHPKTCAHSCHTYVRNTSFVFLCKVGWNKGKNLHFHTGFHCPEVFSHCSIQVQRCFLRCLNLTCGDQGPMSCSWRCFSTASTTGSRCEELSVPGLKTYCSCYKHLELFVHRDMAAQRWEEGLALRYSVFLLPPVVANANPGYLDKSTFLVRICKPWRRLYSGSAASGLV